MSTENIRWQQRFVNYNKALAKLEQAVSKIKKNYKANEDGNINEYEYLDDIIKEGVIQRFEYIHELAWNVMKDFFGDAGNNVIYGSKDATREAFNKELIRDGDIWMDMIRSRNLTSHTYNEEVADEIFSKIMKDYIISFKEFAQKMEELRIREQDILFDKE